MYIDTQRTLHRATDLLHVALLSALLPAAAYSQPSDFDQAPKTRIVLLGTGTPSPDRAGPATAIVVNGTAYLNRFRPGSIRWQALRDLEATHEELRSLGARIVEPLERKPWGLRQFTVEDVGNRFYFHCD